MMMAHYPMISKLRAHFFHTNWNQESVADINKPRPNAALPWKMLLGIIPVYYIEVEIYMNDGV